MELAQFQASATGVILRNGSPDEIGLERLNAWWGRRFDEWENASGHPMDKDARPVFIAAAVNAMLDQIGDLPLETFQDAPHDPLYLYDPSRISQDPVTEGWRRFCGADILEDDIHLVADHLTPALLESRCPILANPVFGSAWRLVEGRPVPIATASAPIAWDGPERPATLTISVVPDSDKVHLRVMPQDGLEPAVNGFIAIDRGRLDTVMPDVAALIETRCPQQRRAIRDERERVYEDEACALTL